MIDFTQYRSILCLNGELPDAAFFNKGLPIIAADGAANTLMRQGIIPHMVIGDLDSLHTDYTHILPTHYHWDQDQNDFQKSMIYLRDHHLLPAVIVGVGGGYIDHILNNINHVIQENCVFYAPPVYGFTLRSAQKHTFTVELNTKLSLLGMPSARVSTQGLQWNLTEAELSFPGQNSCFNRTIAQAITVEVHQGTVLVFLYTTEVS